MSNAFEIYSDTAKPVWRQRQEQTAAKRAETKAKSALERQMAEDATLSKLANARTRERLAALLEGPHGKDIRGLQSFLRTMTLSSGEALVRLVRDARWMLDLDPSDRLMLSRMIGRAIERMRVRNELAPHEDAIPFGTPEDPPTVGEICRTHIDQLRFQPGTRR